MMTRGRGSSMPQTEMKTGRQSPAAITSLSRLWWRNFVRSRALRFSVWFWGGFCWRLNERIVEDFFCDIWKVVLL